MMPDLVNIVGSSSFTCCKQPDRMEIARAGPHGEIVRRHGFEIVVEHVGPRRDHFFERAVLAQEIRRQHFDRRRRAARADGADGLREMLGAAVIEIVAIDRGDDDMRQAELGRRFRDMLRLDRDRARPASPVLTLQKAQARVQVSPMIMKVACFFSQHSPILGQPASSQTVCRPFARTICARLGKAARDRRLARGSSPACAERARPADAPFPDGAGAAA